MFSYLDLNTEQVMGMRWYVTPHGSYPSITTILSGTMSREKEESLERWRKSMGVEKADAYTEARCDHGTIVHALIERFFRDEEVIVEYDGVAIQPTEIAAYNSLKFSLRAVTRVYAQEVALYCTRYEVAGRVDLVGEYKGVQSIVDFKTSARLKSREEINDYKLQMLFYADAHNEMFNTNIQQGVVIMASAGGMPQVFVFQFTDADRVELKARAEAYWDKAALQLMESETENA